MDKTLFKRKEVKYLLDRSTYLVLKERLARFLVEDEYPSYTICNLYFDTEDFDSIRVSVSKPAFKQKMRLRSYGIPQENDLVFLELKKKYNGIVYKRRFNATYQKVLDYLNGGELPEDSFSAREIDFTRKRLSLTPRVFLAYDREAFHGREDRSFRLTFDSNVRYRLERSFSSDGGKLIEEKYVMEIKTDRPYPTWLLELLHEYKLNPTSYSKYGKVYQDILKQRMEKKQ